jgi:aminomethyltransferase
VQGPQAREAVHGLLPATAATRCRELKPFSATLYDELFVSRTGYTGEDGYELALPAAQASEFWQRLLDSGIRPCGLGARDSLRLEAGMNLYGSDMDEETSPLESGLGWTIAWEPEDRDFVGRSVLERQRKDDKRQRFVGLVLTGRGVLRNHLKLYDGEREIGEITSGGFAPTLQRSIAFARLQAGSGDSCEVDLRGKRIKAKVVKPPFVRNGKAVIEL